MSIMDKEFYHRIYKPKLSPFLSYRLDEARKDLLTISPNAEIDTIYEDDGNGFVKPVLVFVFETAEDCLSFALTYGGKYAKSTI